MALGYPLGISEPDCLAKMHSNAISQTVIAEASRNWVGLARMTTRHATSAIVRRLSYWSVSI